MSVPDTAWDHGKAADIASDDSRANISTGQDAEPGSSIRAFSTSTRQGIAAYRAQQHSNTSAVSVPGMA
eukprot:2522646-Rhodomonas_salina.1